MSDPPTLRLTVGQSVLWLSSSVVGSEDHLLMGWRLPPADCCAVGVPEDERYEEDLDALRAAEEAEEVEPGQEVGQTQAAMQRVLAGQGAAAGTAVAASHAGSTSA